MRSVREAALAQSPDRIGFCAIVVFLLTAFRDIYLRKRSLSAHARPELEIFPLQSPEDEARFRRQVRGQAQPQRLGPP